MVAVVVAVVVGVAVVVAVVVAVAVAVAVWVGVAMRDGSHGSRLKIKTLAESAAEYERYKKTKREYARRKRARIKAQGGKAVRGSG